MWFRCPSGRPPGFASCRPWRSPLRLHSSGTAFAVQAHSPFVGSSSSSLSPSSPLSSLLPTASPPPTCSPSTSLTTPSSSPTTIPNSRNFSRVTVEHQKSSYVLPPSPLPPPSRALPATPALLPSISSTGSTRSPSSSVTSENNKTSCVPSPSPWTSPPTPISTPEIDNDEKTALLLEVLRRLDTKMDHHSEEITKFNSHLSTLQFRIDELTARSDVMEQRVGAVEKNLMNALECFTGLAQRVTALETSDVCKDDSDDSEDSNASVVHYRFEDAYREQHGHEAWENLCTRPGDACAKEFAKWKKKNHSGNR